MDLICGPLPGRAPATWSSRPPLSHSVGQADAACAMRERRRPVPSPPLESPRSCGSRVFVKQAAEAISTLYRASQLDDGVGWRTRHSLIEALVWPGSVVVIDGLGQPEELVPSSEAWQTLEAKGD